MSTTALTLVRARTRTHWLLRLADYVELTKPRIGLLVLVTVGVSYCCARWGQPEPWTMVHALLGTLLVAGSASTMNQWLERGLDLRMDRTADRPLPAGRLRSGEAVAFAMLSLLAGELYLLVAVNPAAAAWGFATWSVYVGLYTPLKTRTPLNTAVGAIAGAMPVLIGWSAAGAPYDLRAASLFVMVFLWQFPHFMAIAWMYRQQYAMAGMRMLPVVDPTGRSSGLQAVCGAVALLPVSVLLGMQLPSPARYAYVLAALLLGLTQLAFAVGFCTVLTDAAARNLLRATLLYLPTLLMFVLFSLWI